MYKNASLLLLAIIGFIISYGQTYSINGTVTDSETGKPIAGASIFFSNTSYGTASGNNGSFAITNIRPGKYDLVVSFIGYETHTGPVFFNTSKEGINISLKQKASNLKEVVVRNYLKDGWEKWGHFFLESFIGGSSLSKQCEIKNIKELKFSFSKSEDELIVDATEPLEIQNNALGYNIRYQLENFNYSFKEKFLTYSGYALFEEMEGNKRRKQKWKEARQEVYEVSQMRFMRSLYRNRLDEDGYQLFRLERIPNIERQRLKAKERLYYDTVHHNTVIINYENTLQPDSASYFKKIIAQKDPIEIIHPGLLKGSEIAYGEDSLTAAFDFKNHLIVRYPKRTIPVEYANTIDGSAKQPISSVIFLITGKPVFITSNGYYYNFENMIAEGFWGWWEKLSTLLPYDYTP